MTATIWLYLAVGFLASILCNQFCRSSNTSSGLPRLQKQTWLLGLDTILGHVKDLKSRNTTTRALLNHDTLGHTYESTILGHTTVHTIHPENILAVTTQQFADYGKDSSMRFIAFLIGNGIMVNEGEAWRTSRALLKPLFKRSRRADMAIFQPHVDALMDRLKSQGKDFVDFQRNIQTTVLDIVTDFLCFEDLFLDAPSADQVTRNSGQRLLDLMDYIEPYANLAMELGSLALPLVLVKLWKIWEMFTEFQGFFARAIAKTAKPAPSQNSIADSLVARLRAHGLQGAALQGEVHNIFFAAFDTSTALLTNLFDSVARDSSIWDKLKREMDIVLAGRSGRTLSDFDLHSVVYLRATIFEALRFHGPVKGHSRTAVVDTTLPIGPNGENGIVIPKGTTVAWSTYALNRSPALYNDPNAFRPERWLAIGEDGRAQVAPLKSSFMPFGSGPRNCMGQAFALTLITYVAARIIADNGRIELRNANEPFCEAAAVPLHNGNGTFIRSVESEKDPLVSRT